MYSSINATVQAHRPSVNFSPVKRSHGSLTGADFTDFDQIKPADGVSLTYREETGESIDSQLTSLAVSSTLRTANISIITINNVCFSIKAIFGDN